MRSANHTLYCPFCKATFVWEGFQSISEQPALCGACKTAYRVVFGTVKAKRSKGEGRRAFSLRLLGPHREEKLIEWVAHSADIELRAKDVVAILSVVEGVVSASNFTITRNYDMTAYGWIPPVERARRLARYEAEYRNLPWFKKVVADSPESRLRQDMAELATKQQQH